MGYGAAGGMTFSKMAAKMAAILAFIVEFLKHD